MRSIVIGGVRLLSESAWTTEVLEREALRHERDVLQTELAKLIAAGRALGVQIEQHRATDKQIREAIETVLACNVKLAHRAEQAEFQSERLLGQLHHAMQRPDETERLRRRLTEVVEHVERFCDNPDTIAWVQQRSGLRRP